MFIITELVDIICISIFLCSLERTVVRNVIYHTLVLQSSY
jgi:hypothetical protein